MLFIYLKRQCDTEAFQSNFAIDARLAAVSRESRRKYALASRLCSGKIASARMLVALSQESYRDSVTDRLDNSSPASR